jgi:hypothetical protein
VTTILSLWKSSRVPEQTRDEVTGPRRDWENG